MGGPGFQGPVDAVLLYAVGTNLPAGGPGHKPVPPRPQHPDRDGVRTGKVHRDPERGGLRKILRHPAQSRRRMGGHRGRGAAGPHQGHQDPALRFSGTERPVQKCPAAHSGRRGRRGIRAGVLRAGLKADDSSTTIFANETDYIDNEEYSEYEDSFDDLDLF